MVQVVTLKRFPYHGKMLEVGQTVEIESQYLQPFLSAGLVRMEFPKPPFPSPWEPREMAIEDTSAETATDVPRGRRRRGR